AVVAAKDSVVEDDHRAAIRRGAYQPPKPLLQAQRGLRQRELAEGVAQLLGARGEHRLSRHREWQADDDDAAQPVAGHVDALPEGRGSEQQRAVGLLERLEQLAALPVDALAEDEQLVEVDPMLERCVDVAQLSMRCEQDERAAAGAPGGLRDDVRDGAVEIFVLGQREVEWEAYERLVVEVER